MSEFVMTGQDVFGQYCEIETDFSGRKHVYKCIQLFRSNTYNDVPITWKSTQNGVWHEESTDVMYVIHCGIEESKVVRVAVKDVKFRPEMSNLKEVIRCKDCKHFNSGDCAEMTKLVGDDDFCSFGEREEE